MKQELLTDETKSELSLRNAENNGVILQNDDISSLAPLSDDYLTTGLKSDEINDRIAQGLVNGQTDIPTKTVGRILKDNIFTLFNLVNSIFAALIIWVSLQYNLIYIKNLGFFLIVIINTFLGAFQEIRSKKTIDKLSLISAPKVNVTRDGKSHTISTAEILMDDLILLNAGNQICVDSLVYEGDLEVDESMITGESDAIVKHAGDVLHSGSYVISGNAKTRAIHLGADNYASKISNGARYIKVSHSEIQDSVRAIIKLVTAIIIPLTLLVFGQQLFFVNQPVPDAIVVSVTAIISLMPQGLVLLTSMVFAKGVVMLSMHNTLAQELFSIETLAHVDMLCLDKTGTITTGEMNVEKLIPVCTDFDETTLVNIISSTVTATGDDNPTARALKKKFSSDNPMMAVRSIAFSSARKWSGAVFDDCAYVIGAPEFITSDIPSDAAGIIREYGEKGMRIIALCKANILNEYDLKDVRILALIIISDEIRAEAPDTLRYFADQKVSLKIISGDNPLTVSKIALRAGLDGADKYVDASTLTTDEMLSDALDEYTVFGRVTPDQKLSIVRILKQKGHTVGMTGDGVNDVLALKEADCSVVMAAGSDAARTVANLVLLDNNFASMPKVVQEGRRSINNLQRSSMLFLVKTVYAFILTIVVLISNQGYPFETIQLTLISTATVGIPSIILALEPNNEPIRGKFIHNTLFSCLPFAMTIVFTLVGAIIYANVVRLNLYEMRNLCSIVLAVNMFFILLRVCMPFNLKHAVLYFAMLIAFVAAVLLTPSFFSLMPIKSFVSDKYLLSYSLATIVVAYPMMILFDKLFKLILTPRVCDRFDKLLNLSDKLNFKV